ncbi:MAG: HNH endonuclease [Rhodobacteraceae bacterium]|nr:HNH endonuclease [Paracoccaceae bacterium]
MSKPLPLSKLLRTLLNYHPDTGYLFWRARTPDMFTKGKYPTESSCAWWNSKFANKHAFKSVNWNGYYFGGIFGHSYQAHRIIFALVSGECPAGEIDHINGVKKDNRIANLRMVTHAENMRNQRLPTDNNSGRIGVSWHKCSGAWRAQISDRSQKIHLGTFHDINDAAAARAVAEAKYGYHKNHGRAS